MQVLCTLHSYVICPITQNYIAANIRDARKYKIRRSPSVERLNVLEAKKAMEYAGYQRGVVPQ